MRNGKKRMTRIQVQLKYEHGLNVFCVFAFYFRFIDTECGCAYINLIITIEMVCNARKYEFSLTHVCQVIKLIGCLN